MIIYICRCDKIAWCRRPTCW